MDWLLRPIMLIKATHFLVVPNVDLMALIFVVDAGVPEVQPEI